MTMHLFGSILTAILSYCTAGIYLPWGLCNITRWEYERVS